VTHDFSNARMARRFQAAMRVWEDRYEDELPALLIEIRADARHWCDASGRCFADLDRRAYGHYLRERYAGQGDDQ
jgi:hypothetical protein